MTENAIIKPNFEVVGNVKIDYLDDVTGRVKERFSGKNHVFLDSFATTNWWARLSATDYDTFFLTDDDTPPTDEFQYLRGNIIGWGRVGGESSGLYRGKFVSTESILDGDVDNGAGRRWRYVYTFTADQILQPIKSMGISMQYSSEIDTPMKRRKFPTNQNAVTTMHDNKLYSCANGTLTIFNPFTGLTTTRDLTQIVGSGQGNMCVGFDDNGYKAYIFRVGSAVANRKLYEFLDDTFLVLTNEYSLSNWTSHPDSKGFIVRNGVMWCYSSGWYKGDFTVNAAPGMVMSPIPASVYGIGRLATSDGHIFSKNGYAYKRYSQNATNELPVWDMENDCAAAFISTRTNTSTNYQGCSVFDTSAQSGHQILLSAWENNASFAMKQAYTCYILPSDAPERPDGAGMKITYQIDVNY